MSGISGGRTDGNWAGRDAGGRNWEDLSSGNERLVQWSGELPPPDGASRASEAERWSALRGRCDLRLVVTAA
jgi:hypothetical protein